MSYIFANAADICDGFVNVYEVDEPQNRYVGTRRFGPPWVSRALANAYLSVSDKLLYRIRVRVRHSPNKKR